MLPSVATLLQSAWYVPSDWNTGPSLTRSIRCNSQLWYRYPFPHCPPSRKQIKDTVRLPNKIDCLQYHGIPYTIPYSHYCRRESTPSKLYKINDLDASDLQTGQGIDQVKGGWCLGHSLADPAGWSKLGRNLPYIVEQQSICGNTRHKAAL